MLAAGLGRKVVKAWRSEGEGGGRREEGGGRSSRSGKLRAAFPPQSVEQERGGARRRRRRLLRHQTPGLGWVWGHLLCSQQEPLSIGFSLTFFLIHFFFLFLFFCFFLTFFFSLWLWISVLQPEPSEGSALWGCPALWLRKGRAPGVVRRKEEKLVGGVSPVHRKPLPAIPTLPRGTSQDGKVAPEPTALLDLEEVPALAVELYLF